MSINIVIVSYFWQTFWLFWPE